MARKFLAFANQLRQVGPNVRQIADDSHNCNRTGTGGTPHRSCSAPTTTQTVSFPSLSVVEGRHGVKEFKLFHAGVQINREPPTENTIISRRLGTTERRCDAGRSLADENRAAEQEARARRRWRQTHRAVRASRTSFPVRREIQADSSPEQTELLMA